MGNLIEKGLEFAKKSAIPVVAAAAFSAGAPEAQAQTSVVINNELNSHSIVVDGNLPELQQPINPEQSGLNITGIEITTMSGETSEITALNLADLQADPRFGNALNSIADASPGFAQFMQDLGVATTDIRVVISGYLDENNFVVPTPTPEPDQKIGLYFSFNGGGVFALPSPEGTTWNYSFQDNGLLLQSLKAETAPESVYGGLYIFPNPENHTLEAVYRESWDTGVLAVGRPDGLGKILWEPLAEYSADEEKFILTVEDREVVAYNLLTDEVKILADSGLVAYSAERNGYVNEDGAVWRMGPDGGVWVHEVLRETISGITLSFEAVDGFFEARNVPPPTGFNDEFSANFYNWQQEYLNNVLANKTIRVVLFSNYPGARNMYMIPSATNPLLSNGATVVSRAAGGYELSQNEILVLAFARQPQDLWTGLYGEELKRGVYWQVSTATLEGLVGYYLRTHGIEVTTQRLQAADQREINALVSGDGTRANPPFFE